MLVFSSAQRTNSEARKGPPFQRLSYRSRMRPAFSANCGSRGKIQLRCRQGRRASALSHRHRVLPLISPTMPCVITSRWISERDNRDKGNPDRKSTRLNSSHSQISYAVFCLKKKKQHLRAELWPPSLASLH